MQRQGGTVRIDKRHISYCEEIGAKGRVPISLVFFAFFTQEEEISSACSKHVEVSASDRAVSSHKSVS